MNMIPDIAKTLEVEIGEKFYVQDTKGKYYTLNGERMQFYFDGYSLMGADLTSCDEVLRHLLNGTYEVVKKKWKPVQGDIYWRIVTDDTIEAISWDRDVLDLTYYAAGNCFKTKEEALENLERISKKLQSQYEEED